MQEDLQKYLFYDTIFSEVKNLQNKVNTSIRLDKELFEKVSVPLEGIATLLINRRSLLSCLQNARFVWLAGVKLGDRSQNLHVNKL